MLGGNPAGQALHPPQRHLQPDALIEQIPVTHAAQAALVDQATRAQTTSAARIDLRIGLKTQEHFGLAERDALDQTKSCPISRNIDSITHEGGGLVRWECESDQLKPASAALLPS